MRPVLHLNGLLYRVDPVAREIQVRIDGQLTTLHVCPECDVFLNRERVKLRLLQPLDVVAIDCKQTPGGLVAQVIRSGWHEREASRQENETAAGKV